MNLTFDQAVKEHRKMWRAIAEMEYVKGKKIGDYKKEYLNKRFEEKEILNHCFCCEYTINDKTKMTLLSDCSKCPFMWADNHRGLYTFCCNPGSPYDELYNCINYPGRSIEKETFKRLCLEIAELPVNEKAREKYE